MKKHSFLIIIFISIILLISSCNSEPTYTAEEWEEIKAQEKSETYRITTYDLSQKDRLTLNIFLNSETLSKFYSYESEEELLKDIIDHKFDLEYLDDNIRNSAIKKYYQASEIISYSDTDCRFIDKNSGMEKFISADYIQIK